MMSHHGFARLTEYLPETVFVSFSYSSEKRPSQHSSTFPSSAEWEMGRRAEIHSQGKGVVIQLHL